jgi:predicted nucleic acid-binding protein
MAPALPPATVATVVIDTNIVLDLLVFADPMTQTLHDALSTGSVAWLGTAAMRDELVRVLAYPALQAPMAARALLPAQVLSRYDLCCRMQPLAARCMVRCSDADDQQFIDLAVTHRAALLSKDKAVLRLRKRLGLLGVPVLSVFSQPAT